jgi:hypothetical protein
VFNVLEHEDQVLRGAQVQVVLQGEEEKSIYFLFLDF